jgi:RND family efflux transporter MFP subunit
MVSSTTLLVTLMAVAQTSSGGAPRQVQAESVIIRLIDDVDVAAQAAGLLYAIDVAEGRTVEKGMRLAQIDDTEARLMQERAVIELKTAARKASDDVLVRSAQKSLAFAQADLSRLRRADEELPRSVSQTQLEQTQLQADQAEFELEKARRELELAKWSQQLKKNELLLAERNLRSRQILSPISGLVVDVKRRPGEWVEPGDTVMRIVRIDRLRAEGLVLAAEMKGIVAGAAATVTVDLPEIRDNQFAGEVVFVSPEISAVNGRFRVWADVDNRQGLLKPGLRATLAITPVAPGEVVQRQVR